MEKLRIVFFGTPEFAVSSLSSLNDAGYHIVAVVTAPDKPAGRGHKLQSPPVKIYAESHSIPCLQPKNLKDPAFIDELRSFDANLQIVVAFRMLPEIVWNMPKHGTYNVHASLLPDYRGAAPINWAIINGEKTTGVTTFKLKHEIDTGSILFQNKVEISDDDTAGTLHDKLMHAGAKLLVRSVSAIANGNIELKPQPESSIQKEAPKLFKDTCKINWNQSGNSLRNFVRGLNPFPAAYTKVKLPDGREEHWKIFTCKKSTLKSDAVGKIKTDGSNLYISCEDMFLEITEIQTPGKKRMATKAFINGLKWPLDEIEIVL